MKEGILILVVGLPGSGKGTLISHVREQFPEIVFPVSWTTRARRPDETEGLVYHFATEEEFDIAVAAGEFLEWVSIDGGHRYGTLKRAIEAPLEEGSVVLREVEVQGARHIRQLLPDTRIVSVFITSENGWDDLEKRIRGRAPINEEELSKRKERYERELLFRDEADYVIENRFGELEASKQHVSEIIKDLIQ